MHHEMHGIRLTPRRMPAKHKRGMVYPAITALWLDFHNYATLYSLMIASNPMYFNAFILFSAFCLTEYAPHCTR